MVAREGSVSQASKCLRLAQPTITGQVRALENALGEKLFVRSGRKLVLTDMGRVVYRYANEIFTLGRELSDVLKGHPSGRPVRLVVGVSDVLPKLIAYRFLEPALRLAEPVQLICYEDRPERLMAELATFELDLVLADAPLGDLARVRAYSHLLGNCGVTFFAAPSLSPRYKRHFPASLDGAPFLLPVAGAALRRSLEQWFEKQQIRPRVIGEFQDSALLNAFGGAGVGVFVAPTPVERDVRRHFGVSILGRTSDVVERFYLISVERKIKHPAIIAISEKARQTLSADQPVSRPAA
jgi:LysR family transcriptional activator of nhaA